ncbi:hypothetical protein Poli38472_011290 [Pythium oligandrum]|uniref:Uncharacterized protein n=1 Tax=Pythium oligandrum TaxID=41045 RepID=A0A8K1CS06_PYTOL|nr:hypothetical protein Poli38472_011290 [Pythium oligandrum]|eukprot:TMW67670.1 hypothetical protein Poli38472_011290 [Pythium oligandrum]
MALSSTGASAHGSSTEAASVEATQRRGVLLDTRAYQDLAPLRLPPKLRDRVTKAQRRAAAEKDGVSIFTAAETASAQQKEIDGLDKPAGAEKRHLPDVVLAHKMREFEAKTHANALFVDPLETQLSRLSLEDKERVMTHMQSKIQAIVAKVELLYHQVKGEMDAHGVFDTAANAQRAQALCLVELQKRCRLDKLRDEAMREVLGSSGEHDDDRLLSQMEGKLNQLLQAKTLARAKATEEEAIKTTQGMRSRPSTKHMKRELGASKRKIPATSVNNQKGGNAEPPTAFPTKQDGQVDVPDVGRGEDSLLTRHPHIVHVIQQLAMYGGQPPASTNSTEGTGVEVLSGDENSKAGSVQDVWNDRSASYQTIARRVSNELFSRHERWRWDTTQHFHPQSRSQPLSTALTTRLRIQHGGTSVLSKQRNDEDEDKDSNVDKQKKLQAEYQQLQTRITQRLQVLQTTQQRSRLAESSSLRAFTAPSSNTRVVNTTPPVQRAVTASETPPPQVCPVVLGTSASAPTLSGRLRPGQQPVDQTEELRRSFLDRRLPNAIHTATINRSQHRHTRHRDSLIGAPVAMDMAAPGHHSNARLEERRNSAQTWTWHTASRLEVPETLAEGDSTESDDDDASSASSDEDDHDEARDGLGRVLEEDIEDASTRNGDEDDVDSESDTHSSSRFFSMESARSLASTINPQRACHRKNKKRGRHSQRLGNVAGPHGSRLVSRFSHTSNASSLNASTHSSANAYVLQQRLEELWRVLEFPFSTKLLMLEKYAAIQGGEALQRALSVWEAAAEMVVVREKLRTLQSEFAEHRQVKHDDLLKPNDWLYLVTQDVDVPKQTSHLSTKNLMEWIDAHMDDVTQRCEQLGQQLKVTTGEELSFQGQRYPSRV